MKLKRLFFDLVRVVIGLGMLAWLCLPRPALLDGITYSRRVMDRNDLLLFTSLSTDQKYRLYQPLSGISPAVVRATLIQEDRYFDVHPGINPIAIVRSLVQLLPGHRLHSGASTISMQVARLRYHLRTRTFSGKLVQILRAIQLERYYSKAQIMEAYLNLAPYGGNIEGIEAASQIYFGKPASKLTLPEAAALAVIPQNPLRRALRFNTENPAQHAAQNRLLTRLAASPEILDFRVVRECRLPFLAPHFTREVLRGSPSGNDLRCTLDLDLQRLLEARIATYLETKRSLGVTNAAALLVDTRGMEILAQVGSSDFASRAIDGQVDCTVSPRSPGSTLKPFIYALAIQQGLIHPLSVLEDTPCNFGGYNPENFDREFAGPIRAADALARSRNIPAITLAAQLSQPTLYEFLQSAGIPLSHDESFYGLTLPLGGADITMQDLVKLYGALANNGFLQNLQSNLLTPSPSPRRILSPEAAFLTLEMLRTSRPELPAAADPDPIFWKTGTSNGFHDAWAIAVFDHYILAVWLGNANGRPNPALVGRTCAAPLLFQSIDSLCATGRVHLTPHLPPPGANLKRVEFCSVSGQLAGPYCKHRIPGWFIPGISPISACNVHRPVLIDIATGMRVPAPDLAHPAKTDIYEFWPANIMKLFREAGLPRRRPPPWLPGTHPDALTYTPGDPPRIVSPYPGATYELQPGQINVHAITLQAQTQSDVDQVYWFAGKQFIGHTSPHTALTWSPCPGAYCLTVVDDAGRAASESVQVRTAISLTAR